MSGDDKKIHIQSLMKASDILLNLMSGIVEPVPVRDYSKDGSDFRVYAHANGVFHLEKTVDGDMLCDGLTEEQHGKIKDTCAIALHHILGNSDRFLKSNDDSEMLSRHAGVLRLKKQHDSASGIMDCMKAWRGGRPGPKPKYSSSDEGEIVAEGQKRMPSANINGKSVSKVEGQRFTDATVHKLGEGKYIPGNK